MFRTSSDSTGGVRTRLRLKLFMIAALVAMAAFFAACGGSDSTTTESAATAPAASSVGDTTAAAASGPYQVTGTADGDLPVNLLGLVPNRKASKNYNICYFGNTAVNTYIQSMEYGAQTTADSLGVNLTKYIAQWDAAEQLNQLQNAVQKGACEGIVMFATDPNAECNKIKEIGKTIPVVISNFPLCGDDGYTEGTVAESSSQSLAFYTQYAEWAFSELSAKGGGKVAVLSGPSTFGHYRQLKVATETVAKNYPNIEIVQNIAADWTIEGGLSQGQTILQTNPDIAMFLSSYDQNTIGAVKALKAAGKKPGDITIFTMGGDKTTIPMLSEGWIQGIQYLQPIEEVGQAVEILVAHLDGAPTPTFNNLGEGKGHPSGTVQITLENVDQFKPQS